LAEKKDPSKSPRDTNGPVVKTGPTAGNNRSRNDDGAWRKKRSDTGEQKKKSGCFISTVACEFKGLPDDCPELKALRHFRDEYLLNSPDGAVMVEHYYAIAPTIAERLVEPIELEQVWNTIRNCVELIEAEQYDLAKNKYLELVLSLERKHSGNESCSINQTQRADGLSLCH
jgi:hypothetical protein